MNRTKTIWGYLHDFGFGKGFFGTKRIINNKNKKIIDKMDFTNLKYIWPSKDTIRNVKRQLTEYKKIISNHVSDRGLMSGIKNYHNSIIIKSNNPI